MRQLAAAFKSPTDPVEPINSGVCKSASNLAHFIRMLTFKKFLAYLPNVSGPQGEKQIPSVERVLQQLLRPGEIRRMADVPMTEFLYLFHKPLGGNSRNRLLACGVNGEHDQHIRMVEGPREILLQSLRPRVAVRLKNRHDTPVARMAGCAQGCDDLCRMMPVIVDHQDTPVLSFNLESAVRILE